MLIIFILIGTYYYFYEFIRTFFCIKLKLFNSKLLDFILFYYFKLNRHLFNIFAIFEAVNIFLLAYWLLCIILVMMININPFVITFFFYDFNEASPIFQPIIY